MFPSQNEDTAQAPTPAIPHDGRACIFKIADIFISKGPRHRQHFSDFSLCVRLERPSVLVNMMQALGLSSHVRTRVASCRVKTAVCCLDEWHSRLPPGRQWAGVTG